MSRLHANGEIILKTVYLFCRWFGGGSPQNHEFETREEADAFAQECLDDYSPMVSAITNDYNNAVQFYDPDIREFVGAIIEQQQQEA